MKSIFDRNFSTVSRICSFSMVCNGLFSIWFDHQCFTLLPVLRCSSSRSDSAKVRQRFSRLCVDSFQPIPQEIQCTFHPWKCVESKFWSTSRYTFITSIITTWYFGTAGWCITRLSMFLDISSRKRFVTSFGGSWRIDSVCNMLVGGMIVSHCYFSSNAAFICEPLIFLPLAWFPSSNNLSISWMKSSTVFCCRDHLA